MHLSAIDLTLILLAQALLTVLPVGFTKPGSWIRKASIAVSTILMLISVFGHKDSYDCLTRMILVFSPPALVLQNLNLSLLRRWDFDYAGPQPREPGKREPSRSLPDSVWNRLAFGFCAATEYRHCATPWEVENVPRFRKSDPESVPSRREFLVRRGLLLLCIYLFMDLLGVLASQDVNKAPTELLPLFGRIEDFTMREVLDRFILVVLFFVFGAASTTLHFGYGGYLLTLFGLTEPKRWRPVVNFEHGMPYSIRRLWSHYWHLCFKDMFYQPARYVADHVLRLRRGSTARRYSIVALTFALSGVYHLLCDLTVGVPFGQSRSMVFFLGHACAVVLEDSVSRICRIQTGGKGGEKVGVEKVPRWQRWIGRVWVCAFLSWIVPIYMSPLFLAARDERLVPFSIVNTLKAYME